MSSFSGQLRIIVATYLVLSGLRAYSGNPLVIEKPTLIEESRAMSFGALVSDRKGHVFFVVGNTTTLVTNDAALWKGLSLEWPVAVQPDGGFVGRRDPTRVVSRTLPDGSPDPNFVAPAVNPGDTDNFYDICAQPDGKLIIACGPLDFGKTSPFEGINRGLFRLNADGSFDPSFGTGGGSAVAELFVLPDARIYLLTTLLSRSTPDGLNDSTFPPVSFGGGFGANDFDVQPSGKIIVVGTFVTVNGINRPSIARIDQSGNLDPTFARVPIGFGGLHGVRVLSDGSVIIMGTKRVGKLTPDGALDQSFPPVDTQNGLAGIGVDSTDRVYFNNGDLFLRYSGRLRVVIPAADISTLLEQSANAEGPWSISRSIPSNTSSDYLLPNFPGPGNEFFRLRPAQ